MPLKYARIMAAVASGIWAIEEDYANEMLSILAYKASGGSFTAEEIAARIEGNTADEPRTSRDGTVAVLGLRGVLSPRVEAVDNMSGGGGTAAESFRRRFAQAVNDTSVASIVLDIDSPGGNVQGIPETFSAIMAARGTKPIVAVANNNALSAAFWIASAADEIVVTPSGDVGSIGVRTMHEDLSEKLASEGVKRTVISAGRFKAEGSETEELSSEAAKFLQQRVDTIFEKFTKDVAKGRGVSVKTVRGEFGEGRVVDAQRALAAGMVDRIGSLDGEVQRLTKRRTAGTRRRRLALR